MTRAGYKLLFRDDSSGGGSLPPFPVSPGAASAATAVSARELLEVRPENGLSEVATCERRETLGSTVMGWRTRFKWNPPSKVTRFLSLDIKSLTRSS